MKKIIYRLIFKYNESKDKTVNRDNRISSVLSDDNVIDTEEQIKSPNIGSIIVIEDIDYKVSVVKQAYTTDENNVYNTTIVILDKIVADKKTKPINNSIEDLLKLRGKYTNPNYGDFGEYPEWTMKTI